LTGKIGLLAKAIAGAEAGVPFCSDGGLREFVEMFGGAVGGVGASAVRMLFSSAPKEKPLASFS